MTMAKVAYKHTFDAKMATNIGEDSVSDVIQAVLELAKNSYDADAQNVIVKFDGTHSSNFSEDEKTRMVKEGFLIADKIDEEFVLVNKVSIIDDGIAMTDKDLKEKYFRLGTATKVHNTLSPKLKRRVVGEKGMGHYAAKRIGDVCTIISNPENYKGREFSEDFDKTITVKLDWDQFQQGRNFTDIESEGDITGIPTGYRNFDKYTAGLQNQDLIIIAGRPSMGKTTLAVNIAENAAIGKKIPTAIFSMEMSSEQLMFRMISSLGRVDSSHLRTGNFHDEDWLRINTAVQLMSDAPLYIDDTPAMTPIEVRARARRLKREHGLGLIILDYMQLMHVSGSKENRATEISEISRSLKALAKELKIPIIALSQLNRAVDSRTDKRPILSDLRESGAIEQDADLIVFLFREEEYNPDTPRRGIADIKIAKQRNGPTGEFLLTFIGRYTKFENYSPEPDINETYT